ncbi:MAG: tetratricopeptide repeat protein [Bacteroidia bacterium]
MNKTCRILLLLLTMSTTYSVYGQSDKDKAKARELGEQAIKLEDDGKLDEALVLLSQAEKLDPTDYNYPYEEGYSYYQKKDYKKALDVYKKLIANYTVNSDQCYQMLGNVYDLMGDSASALHSYREGLVKFPNSGRLYLEQGNVYWLKKMYAEALPYYEAGIKVEPAFPSNYYRAARVFCSSSEPVYGIIYGEIFMNIERNSKRTAEISKLLFETYKEHIEFKSASNVSVTFSKNNVMVIHDSNDVKNPKLPFGTGCYEINMLLSVFGENAIDLNSLDRIRKRFIESYYKTNSNTKYPNILFDYQHTIAEAGHLEAYNHWILMKGDEELFTKWQDSNKDKWDAFVKWFAANPITLDKEHRFYSSQYN